MPVVVVVAGAGAGAAGSVGCHQMMVQLMVTLW